MARRTGERPSAPIVLAAAVAVAALLAAACGAPPAEPGPEETAVPPELAEGRHVFITADGAAMPYVVSGSGDTTVVLVHCWMCDRSFWDAQVPVLADRYRVITLDLPGHGEGGDGRESWTIHGYGEDVARLVDQLELDRVVLVGHSMGGPVTLVTAALVGEPVVGIVAVDTLHDAEFDYSDPAVAGMIAAFDADFRGMCSNMVDAMFVEDGVDEIEAHVRRVGCEEGNAEAGLALMHDFATLDLPAMFSEAGVPIRAINASGPTVTRIETNRKYADFDAVLIDGVGHYLHMTRPEAFNPLLLRTIDELVGPAT